MPDGTLQQIHNSWQRRVGVEPTRDRAERPPSRFEDGETHRDPYTCTSVAVFCHCCYTRVKPANAPAPRLPPPGTSPSTRLRVDQGDHGSLLRQYSAYRPHVPPALLPLRPRLPGIARGRRLALWRP